MRPRIALIGSNSTLINFSCMEKNLTAANVIQPTMYFIILIVRFAQIFFYKAMVSKRVVCDK